MKTKNNTFLTFLDKMQFSEILCLATYDWFCADGSQIQSYLTKLSIGTVLATGSQCVNYGNPIKVLPKLTFKRVNIYIEGFISC